MKPYSLKRLVQSFSVAGARGGIDLLLELGDGLVSLLDRPLLLGELLLLLLQVRGELGCVDGRGRRGSDGRSVDGGAGGASFGCASATAGTKKTRRAASDALVRERTTDM